MLKQTMPEFTAHDLTTKLQPVLLAELALYTQLQDLLISENSALSHGDIVALETINQDKTQLILQLKQCMQQRQSRWPISQHDTATAIEQRLKSAGHAEILTVWENLRTLAAACQEHNRLNGVLIQQLNLSTQQALHILCHNHPGHTALYGPQGLNTALPRSNTIIS